MLPPSQYSRMSRLLRDLGDMLRAELRATQEAINSHESAIRDANRSGKEEQAKIGSAIGTTISTAINTAADSVPIYERTQRAKEHGLQWRMFFVTLFGALVATAAAIGAFYYAAIAKDQLGQMIEATKQAKRSAHIAACALRENQRQFSDTLNQMKTQTRASEDEAGAAKSAAKTAEDELITANRPWVAVNGPLGITGGSIHDNPSKVTFGFQTKNVGNSMALQIQSAMWINPDPITTHHCEDLANWLRRDIALHERFKRHPGPGGIAPESGEVLLPGATNNNLMVPQDGGPTVPTKNVSVMICTIYADQFKIVHLTENDFCYFDRSVQLKDNPPELREKLKDMETTCGGYAY